MDIQQFATAPMTPALAYVLGMIFPFYIDRAEVVDEYSGKKYAAGCVNHNSGFYTEEKLAAHFHDVRELLREYHLPILLKTNKKNDRDPRDFSCSSKPGFSCLIETTGITKEDCEDVFRNRVLEIQTAGLDICRKFVAGCFDGRGSWDTTLKCLSIDVDKKVVQKELRADQDIIRNICDMVLGENSVQINRRDWDHKKHDQIRIRKNFVRGLLDNCGLYSAARIEILSNALNALGL